MSVKPVRVCVVWMLSQTVPLSCVVCRSFLVKTTATYTWKNVSKQYSEHRPRNTTCSWTYPGSSGRMTYPRKCKTRIYTDSSCLVNVFSEWPADVHMYTITCTCHCTVLTVIVYVSLYSADGDCVRVIVQCWQWFCTCRCVRVDSDCLVVLRFPC